MKKYMLMAPTARDFCVPSTIQSLLYSKRIIIPQSLIAEIFPKADDGKGLAFNSNTLEEFFGKFGLKSEFHNPHESPMFYEDIDLALAKWVKESDVIMAYDLSGLKGNAGLWKGHVSLAREFDAESRGVTIADCVFDRDKFPIGDLVRSMNPWENKNYGFYVISEK